jgi:sorbitol/mannitol transport system substrate-binding protein
MPITRRTMLRSTTALLGSLLIGGRGIRKARAQGKEVRIIATGEAYGAAMKFAAEAFTKKTGIKVTIDQLPYADAYNKEVLLGTAGSDEYDIMVLDCIWLPIFVKNKWVQSLEPLEAKAETKVDWPGFVKGIVDTYDVYGGERYAAPIDFFIEVLAYRPDLFSKAGLSAAPKTWDEFRTYAEKLNDPKSNVYGVSTMPGEQDGGYSEWTVRLAGLEMPPNANQFVWDKSFKSMIQYKGNGKKALDRWLEIKPFTAPGSNEMGYAEATNAFMQGNAAMYVDWYAFFSDVENPQTSKVAGQVQYVLPPRETLEGQRRDYLGGFQIAIATNAPDPDSAYQFIAFVTSDEGQEIMLENGAPGGYRSNVYSNEKWLKRYPFLAPIKDAEIFLPLTADFAEYVEMQRLIYNQLFAAWAGQKSSADAMADADQGLNKLMVDLGYQKS